MPTGKPRTKLRPLGMTCTSTDCDNGLHCFRATKKMAEQNQQGRCRACGADLVDWERLRRRDLTDVQYTFDALRKERIRHHFWHKEIDEKAVIHARKKGLMGMQAAADNRIRKSVGTKGGFDGRQTPLSGNALYYAQHSTACCCRKCIKEWYDIPVDRPLTEAEIQFFTDLCMLYVKARLPQLTADGEKIPARRTNRKKGKAA